jgi:NADPH-dependent curcumin reductase CurA
MKSKQVQLKKRPEGMPSKEDFQTKEVDIGEVGDGEFAVRNGWFSVDPYMRGRMKDTESYVPPFALGEAMEGGCVGKVTESKNQDFPVGTWVLGNSGWRDNWISDGEGVVRIDAEQARHRALGSRLASPPDAEEYSPLRAGAPLASFWIAVDIHFIDNPFAPHWERIL